MCVNRAGAALRITFEVPSEMSNHLEILPKTAFIQAKSEFAAQIKFIARQSLAADAPTYFDPLTGVLELPLQIKVADQVSSIRLTPAIFPHICFASNVLYTYS